MDKKRVFNIAVVLLNIALLLIAFMFYARYTAAYEERLREENINNVANLNESAIMSLTQLFESCNIKLKDIEKYVETNNLTLDEALALICGENSSEDRYFQLIGSDYKGFLAEKDASTGGFVALDYSENSYKAGLHAIVDSISDGDEILFAPEFTDAGTTGVKFFAIYRHITLQGEAKPWTLLLAMKAKHVAEVLNSQSGYEGQSTVLINSFGDFIVNNKYFTSSNLFDYIRERNGLSFEERNAIQADVQSNSSGELYYQKLNGPKSEDFVFRYEKMSSINASGWYCVTCVPISSFQAPEFNFSYIIDMAVTLLIMIVIDIVWLNALNRRLRESMLREKEASLAKGNFLSRMSHEIRTPLNAVIGYNMIAHNEMEKAKDDAERKQAEMKVMDCLEKSGIASKHLLTIINDVLDVSAIESGKVKIAHEKFDFKGLITSLTTVFYSQASAKGISFEVVFHTLTDEWFIGDQLRTNQVLTNLLSNAIKFTPEGGSVTLKILQPEAQAGVCHIHFEVTDTGIGMTSEYLSHIWTPFEQADSSISRRFGGTGLGLSITKNLVDLMGGTISVSSAVGKGTTFTVDLTYELADPLPFSGAYDFSKINALVVDDDISTCDYIRTLFTHCGAKCVAVTSGADALRAVSSSLAEKTPYSLFLVDWQMPKMDGIETIRRIQSISAEKTPFVVLTAYDFSEIAEKANQAGVTKFISKPLFKSSLFDLLVDICGEKPSKPVAINKGYDFDGARILVAEDNTMNMEIAKTLLKSVGFIVDGARNGIEAVNTFTASAPDFYKAILMDVHMPEMNGLDATRAIRASAHPNAKTIPIIAMTADAFAENVSEALESGMNDHVAKPIDLPTLFGTLDKHIYKRS